MDRRGFSDVKPKKDHRHLQKIHRHLKTIFMKNTRIPRKIIHWLGFTVALLFTCGCNAQNSRQSADAIKVVDAFQHLPDDDLQCFDEKSGAHEKWMALKSHVSRLLSPDLLRPYIKVCETNHRMFEPRFNDHLKDKTDDDMLLRNIKNTRYIVIASNKTRAVIRANYDHNACSHQECGNYTEYTLFS